eukprot:m.33128 g.33128  ORF g.33128 m.33128 type:complete len:130 (+) comp8492_c0_seq2:89-478(+)
MTWDAHVHELLKTGNVKHAAIVGLDGGTWAASDGFTVSVDEAQTLVRALDDQDEAAMLPKRGVIVNKTPYMYLRHEDGRNVFGSAKTGGVCVTKTSTALVIATYETPMSFQACICDVEKFADYLISMQL